MEANFNFSATPETRIYNDRNGWTGKTEVFVNGKNWQITTYKTNGGKVSTHCQVVTIEGPGMISFMMFGQPANENFWLNTQPASRCTEKTITEAHKTGLALFFEKQAAGELPDATKEYQVNIGQVFFTDGPGYDQNRRAVYEIIRPGKYKTVLLDGSDLHQDDHVRNYKNKFGIGVYYCEGITITESEVLRLVEEAKKAKEERQKAAILASEAAAIERAAKIKIGAAILPEIPAGAVSVLIGCYEKNESDIYTDYFNSRTEKTVYLAFSTTDRNNFVEMRKAAANFEETAFLAELPAENVENRENYSGGAGYYLGEHKYMGWQVKKGNIPSEPRQRQNFLEALQIAIAENRYFIPEFSETPTPAPVEVPAGSVQIVDYSAKAVAVIGNTKPIKDKLKELGGCFNFRLSCGAGWIFPKSKLEALTAALSN